MVLPVAGHSDASRPNPIAAYYSLHQSATLGLESMPDEPREPFYPVSSPFAPTVTTGGTASTAFPDAQPDLYRG